MLRSVSCKHLVVATVVALLVTGCGGSDDESLRIGLNLESTGSIPNVGAHSLAAAEMFAEEINDSGGVTIGEEQRTLELLTADNAGTADGATAAAESLIDDDVLMMVGPNASVAAVPAGAVANERETPMISPWSTNPSTTLGRPWVFRAPYIDLFQGPILAAFAADEFEAEQACVLFASDSDAPRGVAESFRVAWETNNGPGSVPAYESFITGDECSPSSWRPSPVPTATCSSRPSTTTRCHSSCDRHALQG